MDGRRIVPHFAALTLLGLASQGMAITYVDLGTVAPPGTLGGYAMTAFASDARPVGDPVDTAGGLGFSQLLTHYTVGDGWATWSHGYAGDVYHLDEALFGSELTITLPADTAAFYFYAEPNFFDMLFTLSVYGTSSAGVTVPVEKQLTGDGDAAGFGFYAVAGETLESITITGLDTFPDGFAVGEFGIYRSSAVPEGGVPPLLLGAVLFGLAALYRRSRNLGERSMRD